MNFNNIILGWRNIRKNGVYSIINIAGLSLGIAVVVLILFWVVDELSYDKFHKNLDNIYSVYEHQQYSDGQELFTPCTPFPLSQALVEKYPEIEKGTTFTNLRNQLIRSGDKEYKEGPVCCVDNSFLDVFSFSVIEGNRNALLSSDQIMITEDLARLYFGSESAIGKVMKINDEYSFTVGAVLSKEKSNSSINFKVLAPIDFLKNLGADFSRWGNNWPNTSIILADGFDLAKIDEQIGNLCKENGQPNTTLHLFPFSKLHLYSYSGKNNRIQYIYQFLAIALIIILIASINFINLSTAKAEHRRPEVGIRKVLGANKINILKQFLIEKGIMILLSIVFSGILIVAFLPAFRSVSGKNILLEQLQNKYMISLLLSVVIMILVLSVVYPSLYLSSFSPVMAMKRFAGNRRQGMSLKSLLVIFQFILAVILISGSIAITQQMKYLNDYDLGYNHANLVYLTLDGEARNKYEAIRQEVSKITGVENVTQTDKLPFYGGNSSWGYDWEGKDPENKVLICKICVDNNYFKTMGIKLLDGTTFPDNYDKALNQDEIANPQVILNKEAIRRMGITDPVGKFFTQFGNKKGTIVGVAEDFHFESLHSGVEPLLLSPLYSAPSCLTIRINPANFSQTIDEIKKTWTGILPQTACEVGFFDDRLAQLYNAELKISGLFKYFTFVAIFISCIGLFGLSLFIIERRRKEIGVRKVNGAKTSEVMYLLNKGFAVWVLIAFAIASPVAYYVLSKWLENFACKTALSWWIFALSGLLALGIALLTVSWQSWKAATRNPVEALRYE